MSAVVDLGRIRAARARLDEIEERPDAGEGFGRIGEELRAEVDASPESTREKPPGRPKGGRR